MSKESFLHQSTTSCFLLLMCMSFVADMDLWSLMRGKILPQFRSRILKKTGKIKWQHWVRLRFRVKTGVLPSCLVNSEIQSDATSYPAGCLRVNTTMWFCRMEWHCCSERNASAPLDRWPSLTLSSLLIVKKSKQSNTQCFGVFTPPVLNLQMCELWAPACMQNDITLTTHALTSRSSV